MTDTVRSKLNNIKGLSGDGLEFDVKADKIGIRTKPYNQTGTVDFTYTGSLIGIGLQTKWDGTRLGVKREDATVYDYSDLFKIDLIV